ncbi:MAG: helix-turn-helix domain-containing protein [Bacteroidales bacterium]|nr:helix-turn-helix domain-containing protein [Bacteroidales bacterium]
MEALESIAHTLRGGTTIFFFAWATALYRFRRRSRLMQLIYWGSLVLGFSYLKDSLFLFPQFQDVLFWDDLVSLSDLICVPMACSFCIEAVRPGTSTNWRIAPFLLFHVLCVLSYAVWPGRVVFFSAFVIAFLQVAVTVGLVIVYAGRYRRLLRDNYSSIEQRDVVWIVQFALGYFGLYVAYFVAFETTSWLSESIFSVLMCIVWSYLYHYSCRHRVSYFSAADEAVAFDAVPQEEATVPPESAEEPLRPTPQTGKGGDSLLDSPSVLVAQLQEMMVEQQLFLDPSLTLNDLSDRLCTNRTTLSRCLHQELDSSFYDFVNSYRVAEACRLMNEALTQGETIAMATVSKQSGFNSVTSFNRYFSKLRGVTPLSYFRQLRMQQG